MKRLRYIILPFLLATSVSAQVALTQSGLHQPTFIAPAYFSPNAFPVPQFLDAPTGNLVVEVAGDGYFGTMGDKTADIFARLRLPLFTDRVNLVVWLPIVEWYENTLERQRYCRLQDTAVMRGSVAGDVYVSTDILVFRERKFVPSITLRAALKTASGGGFPLARNYDNPGYFFDAALAKHFTTKSGRTQFHVAASGGFLCWQTDNGRQNDAVMYGVKAGVKFKYISLNADWAGYVGWEHQGDRPMIIRADLRAHIKGFEPYLMYQYGIQDYPWHLCRIGLAYNLNVLRWMKKKE